MERISISTADLQDRVETLTDRIRTFSGSGREAVALRAELRRIEDELAERELAEDEAGVNPLSTEFHRAVLDHLRVDAGVEGATFEYPGYIEIPMADGHVARVGQHAWDYATYLDPHEPQNDAVTIDVDVDEDETDPSAVALAITEALDSTPPLPYNRVRELAEMATRELNDNADYHGAIVDSIEKVMGTRDFPGDVDPGATIALDEALEGMFRQLIENAWDARRHAS